MKGAAMVREGLIGSIFQWFFLSVGVGLILASYRYPFFIQSAEGGWKLSEPTIIEANLLLIASILIGVAVVQGQNLNRLLDIRHQMRERRKEPDQDFNQIYDYLRIGFWLLSLDVLLVIALLALAICFGTTLSGFHAFILAAFWWSAIALIIAGWICLAIVAGRSYKD
jgi:hypothetical protein